MSVAAFALNLQVDDLVEAKGARDERIAIQKQIAEITQLMEEPPIALQ